MSEKTLLWVSVGVSITSLIIVAVLAQHLNTVADTVDTKTQGLLGNAKVQSLLTSIGGLFGGDK